MVCHVTKFTTQIHSEGHYKLLYIVEEGQLQLLLLLDYMFVTSSVCLVIDQFDFWRRRRTAAILLLLDYKFVASSVCLIIDQFDFWRRRRTAATASFGL